MHMHLDNPHIIHQVTVRKPMMCLYGFIISPVINNPKNPKLGQGWKFPAKNFSHIPQHRLNQSQNLIVQSALHGESHNTPSKCFGMGSSNGSNWQKFTWELEICLIYRPVKKIYDIWVVRDRWKNATDFLYKIRISGINWWRNFRSVEMP